MGSEFGVERMSAWKLLLLAGIGAVVLPSVCLRLTLEPGTSALGWSAPCGWYGLALVQTLAVLPLNVLVCLAAARRPPAFPRQPRRFHWLVVVGLGTFLLSLSAGNLSKVLAGTSMPVHLGVGLLLASVVQAPWCLLGVLQLRGIETPSRLSWCLAVLAALVLPWMYNRAVIERETRIADELLAKMQLSRAQPVVVALCDMGSTQPIGGKAPREARRQLEEELKRISAEAASSLSDQATVEEKCERARRLAMADRLEEAARLLEPLQDHLPAVLLQAGICQSREDFVQSDCLYRHSLTLDGSAPDRTSLLHCRVQAYDGLAFNARATKRFTDAEAIYREALTRLPPARAYFYFQLGRHYHLGGRPTEAIDYLRQAVVLDPSLKAQAAPLLNEMKNQTPGCLLRR